MLEPATAGATGSQIASPKMSTEAEVTATPMKEKSASSSAGRRAGRATWARWSARVAREVGDVERQRGPEADHGGERRDEEAQELGGALELGWAVEDRAEAAGARHRPGEQRQPGGDQERRRPGFQELDRVAAADHDVHVPQPRRRRRRSRRRRARCSQAGNAVFSMVWIAWPPIQVWMPNQPQATRPRSRAGTLAPAGAEGGAREHRKGDAVARAGVGDERPSARAR